MRRQRYTILRKIAEGGMAEIFLAKQHGSVGFEKLVVLKRILTAFYADDQFRNMLVDEAHISMGLSHSNIAQILDVGQAGGRFFLVLELVDGWDLGRVLKRAQAAGVSLPLGLGLYVLIETCRALAYAHGKTGANGRPLGIVHRDISPQNILISEHGAVKLIDFGVAKALTKRDQTGAGIVKGKVSFMAPEQALGREIDARADLYAVGILLYTLAVGRRPFEAATDMEILLRAQSGQYPPPEQASPQISPAVAAVIRKAMAFDPAQRYQTADELLVDLEQILRAEHAGAGQTALKQWLAALSRRDKELPIGRATAAQFASPGSDSVEIELDDDGEPTSPAAGHATVSLRASEPRLSGLESTSVSDLVAALPEDGLGPGRLSRQVSSDVLLAVPEEEGPPALRRERGGFPVIGAAIAVVVLGGGALAWRWQAGRAEPAPAEAPVGGAASIAEPAPAEAPVGVAAPVTAPAAGPDDGEPDAGAAAGSTVIEAPAEDGVAGAPGAAVDPAPVAPGAASPALAPAARKERAPSASPAPADPYARARAWQQPLLGTPAAPPAEAGKELAPPPKPPADEPAKPAAAAEPPKSAAPPAEGSP